MSLSLSDISEKLKTLNVLGDLAEVSRLWAVFLPDLSPDRFFQLFSGLGMRLQLQCFHRSGVLVILVRGHLDGEEVFSFEESFFHRGNPPKKMTELRRIVLAESFQNKRVFSDLFRGLVDVLVDTGLARIELTANIEMGGYCFAKYGFYLREDTDNIESFREEVLAKFLKLKGREREDAEDLLKAVDWHNPITPNLLSVLPFAKKLLAGTYWEGYIDFADQEQMDLLRHAINLQGDSDSLR